MAKLLSLNVRGLINPKKRRAIFKYARDRADLILLQETHSDTSSEEQWKHEWGGNIYFSHGNTDSRGVCLLIKKGFGGKTALFALRSRREENNYIIGGGQ